LCDYILAVPGSPGTASPGTAQVYYGPAGSSFLSQLCSIYAGTGTSCAMTQAGSLSYAVTGLITQAQASALLKAIVGGH
jgi:hypothetical protein